MVSKKMAQGIHFKRRGLSRLGLELTKQDRRDIIYMILSHKATFIKRQSLRVTVWGVVFKGKSFRVIYDSKRNSLVTILI